MTTSKTVSNDRFATRARGYLVRRAGFNGGERAEIARRLVAGESRRVPRDAELEELRARVRVLELAASQACETPDDGCECAGCSLAAQLNERTGEV